MANDADNTAVRLRGRSAAPGLAMGPIARLGGGAEVARRPGTPVEEHGALAAAIAGATTDLTRLSAEEDDEATAILAFQLALLEDEALTGPARDAIDRGASADVAWCAALDAEIESYDGAADPYFRGRASDLRDLRDRVHRHLCGVSAAKLPAGAIVIAEDIPPSRFLEADWRSGGLVLRRGSPTSHVAILARARGVPMVVGVATEDLAVGREALLDADTGELILDSDEVLQRAFDERLRARERRHFEEERLLGQPAQTAAGERVQVLINVAAPAEVAGFDPANCDGIGLVRTEFLFHGRDPLPNEDEQLAVYCRVLEWADGRPVTIRTLDAGGDKPIPGLTRQGESNPFLGVRGVRLSLRQTDVFVVQLRALARAAATGRLKVMVPMVTVPEEMTQVRALFAMAVAALRREGRAAVVPPLGMMVEVPAAALMVYAFDADFYSIGTNDLIQYVAAASRDEPELTELTRPSRAVLELVGRVVGCARRTRREVSLCGDLASDPLQLARLVDCGLRDISVAPVALAAVKAAIRRYREP